MNEILFPFGSKIRQEKNEVPKSSPKKGKYKKNEAKIESCPRTLTIGADNDYTLNLMKLKKLFF